MQEISSLHAPETNLPDLAINRSRCRTVDSCPGLSKGFPSAEAAQGTSFGLCRQRFYISVSSHKDLGGPFSNFPFYLTVHNHR